MTLYVLRHGIAEATASGGEDRARRLTETGRRRTSQVARGLHELGVEFDLLLTSPLVRAAQTAAIVAGVYNGRPAPRELAQLAAGAPAEILTALKAFANNKSIMIVGHEPGLGRLVSLALAGSPDAIAISLKKAGCVKLELSAIGPHSATLVWSLTPGQLRRLAD